MQIHKITFNHPEITIKYMVAGQKYQFSSDSDPSAGFQQSWIKTQSLAQRLAQMNEANALVSVNFKYPKFGADWESVKFSGDCGPFKFTTTKFEHHREILSKDGKTHHRGMVVSDMAILEELEQEAENYVTLYA